jgi:Uma2 family endonuclease
MIVSESRPQPYRPRNHEDVELPEWFFRNFRQVAESSEQDVAKRTLASSIEKLIRSRGWQRVFVGTGTFFAWKEGDPTRRVAPDVYLLDDRPKQLQPIWCTWLPETPPPCFAVEIVSKRWTKDYVLDPVKYEELGCKELVIFDPHATPRATYPRQRVPLTVFRRTTEGRLDPAYSGKGPGWSEQLGIWLLPIRSTYSPTLRLSEDEAGTRIVLTGDESDEATGRELDRERAERAEERAAHDRKVWMLKEQLERAQAKPAPGRPRRGRKPKPGGS